MPPSLLSNCASLSRALSNCGTRCGTGERHLNTPPTRPNTGTHVHDAQMQITQEGTATKRVYFTHRIVDGGVLSIEAGDLGLDVGDLSIMIRGLNGTDITTKERNGSVCDHSRHAQHAHHHKANPQAHPAWRIPCTRNNTHTTQTTRTHIQHMQARNSMVWSYRWAFTAVWRRSASTNLCSSTSLCRSAVASCTSFFMGTDDFLAACVRGATKVS